MSLFGLDRITTTARRPKPNRRLRFEVQVLEDRLAPAISILFDYSQDVAGFFAARPAAKIALEHAAAEVAGVIQDTLTRIDASPASGNNTWQATYFDPATGNNKTILGPLIPQDTLLVFAGARDHQSGGSGELAEAGPGGYSTSFVDQSFNDNVVGRGHPQALGANPTKFTPWGGSISFDINTNWDFSINTIPAAGKQSFFQTAEHEIGHILGIGGISNQWRRHISGGSFRGPAAMAANGNQPVPLNPNGSHWDSSLLYNGIRPTMVPFAHTDPPNIFTPLDYAALRDIGWNAPANGRGGANFSAQAVKASVAEGGDVSFKVDGSFSDGTQFVHVRTVPGTAKPGVNYQPIDQVLSFYPWQKSKTVTIRTLSDGKPTADLGFGVELLYSETNTTGSPGTIGFTVVNTTAGNRPPIFDPIPNQTGTAGTLFTFQTKATDADQGQTLTYSLGPNAPAGASIGPTTGLLSFTPSQTATTYQIPVVATDNGNPAASGSTIVSLTTLPDPAFVSLALGASASTSRYGQGITFTITASSASGLGVPSGVVTLLEAGSVLAQAALNPSGSTSFTLFGLSVGNHTISAQYNGDSGHTPSTSPGVAVAVFPTATSLNLASNAAVALVGQTVVYSATVVPTTPGSITPTGVVTFFNNGKVLGAAVIQNGVASFAIAFPDTKAKRSITASYGGDGGFTGSRSTKALVPKVVAAPVVINATTTREGATVRFVVSVNPAAPASGVPNGAISVLQGRKVVGSARLVNGRASFTIPLSKVVGKPLTLSYGGEARFLVGRRGPITV